MQVIKLDPYICGLTDEISIFPLGDIHLGTKHCIEKEVRKEVEIIRKCENALWIGMGDLGEYITPRDKRWDEQSISDWVEMDNVAYSQLNRLVALLSPIKDKCIGLIKGNHEESIRLFNNVNIHRALCNALGVRNLGYSCFVHFSFARRGHESDRRLHKGVFTHGGGNCVTRGAKLNRLERFMGCFDADIYGYAHMHDIIVSRNPVLTTTKNLRIKERKRIGAVTGCWFRTYTEGTLASYGEKKTYGPTTLGCPVFKIKPFNKEVWIEGKGV